MLSSETSLVSFGTRGLADARRALECAVLLSRPRDQAGQTAGQQRGRDSRAVRGLHTIR